MNNNRQGCNPLNPQEGNAEGAQPNEQRQRENGAQAIEPRQLTDAEIEMLYRTARRWIEAADASQTIRDLYNLAYTAKERGQDCGLENLRIIRQQITAYDPTRKNEFIVKATGDAYRELQFLRKERARLNDEISELRGKNKSAFEVIEQVHAAIDSFEQAFGVKPRLGSSSATRISNLQTLAEQLESERDHANESLNRGEGFENRSASYVAMFLGEQSHFESFELPLHVRARRYLSDIRRRLAEVESLKNELRATSQLRDSVARNFDDLHAGAIEALIDAWTRAGYGLSAREHAWRALDEAYAAQTRKREAQEGAGQAAGRQEASDAAAPPPTPPAGMYGDAYISDAPLPVAEFSWREATRIAEERARWNRGICHSEISDGSGRVIELREVANDCPHRLVDGIVTVGDSAFYHERIRNIAEGVGRRVMNNVFGGEVGLAQEILVEAMRIGFERLKSDPIARAELNLFIQNKLGGRPTSDELRRAAEGESNVRIIGAHPETVDEMVKLQMRIIREASKRGLPHQTAEVAVGALFARFDSQAESLQQCEEAQKRIGDVVARYAPAIRGNTAHRVEKLIQAMQEELTERNGWLQEIRIAMVSCLPLIPDEEYDDVSPDSDAILPRRLRLILAELTRLRSRAEESAESRLNALVKITDAIQTLSTVPLTAPHELAYEDCAYLFVEQFVQAFKNRLTAQESEGEGGQYHAAALCRATGTQTFGEAMAEVQRLQRLERNGIDQLRRLLNLKFNSRDGVLQMISTLGDFYQSAVKDRQELKAIVTDVRIALRDYFGSDEPSCALAIQRYGEELKQALAKGARADEWFERACRYESMIQQAHSILNVNNVPNDYSKDEGGQTIAERLAAYLPKLIERAEQTQQDKDYRASMFQLFKRMHDYLDEQGIHSGDILDRIFALGNSREDSRGVAEALRAFEPVNFPTIENETIAERVTRLLSMYRAQKQQAEESARRDDDSHKKTLAEMHEIFDRAQIGFGRSIRARVALACELLARETSVARNAEKYAQELEAAKSVLWSFTLAPEWMHDIRQAETIADAINVLNNARLSQIGQACEQGVDDWREALAILRRVDGVPQERSLTETADIVAALAAERGRVITREVCKGIAQRLFERYDIRGAKNGLPTTDEHLANWLFDFAKAEGANVQGGRPRDITLDDCAAIARDIKRQFVVLNTAHVFNAADGVSDDTLAQALFQMLNPQQKQEAEQDGGR